MIWGMVLHPGDTQTEVVDGEVHLSMASLECRPRIVPAKDATAHVILKTNYGEYLLCSLGYGPTPQQNLDLILQPQEQITFSVEGNGTVYLTGYTRKSRDLLYSDGWDETVEREDELSEDQNAQGHEMTASPEVKTELVVEGDECMEGTEVTVAKIEEDEDLQLGYDSWAGTSLSEPTQQQATRKCLSCSSVLPSNPEDPSSGDGDSHRLYCRTCMNVMSSTAMSGPSTNHGRSPAAEQNSRLNSTPSEVNQLPVESQRITNFPSTVSHASSTQEMVPHQTSRLLVESQGVTDSLSVIPQSFPGERSAMHQMAREPVMATNMQVSPNPNFVTTMPSASANQVAMSSQDWSSADNSPFQTHQRSLGKHRVANSHVLSNQNLISSMHPTRPNLVANTTSSTNHFNTSTRGNTRNSYTARNSSPNKRSSNSRGRRAKGADFYRERGIVFKCDYCPKTFPSPAYRKIHERSHTGEKPYKCRFCPRAFTQCTNWKSHEMTHTGERPHKCAFCEKTFIRTDALKSHQWTHSGVKPFQCQYCSKGYSQRAALNNHERSCNVNT